MNKTCTIIARATAVSGPFSTPVVDDYGSATYAETTSEVACEIQQVQSTEPGEQGEFSVSSWLAWFPSGTVLDTGDGISEPGSGTFEVVGKPWNADSGSSAVNHVMARLKEAQ